MWFFSVYANTVIDLRYIYIMRTIYCVTDEPGFKLQVSSMLLDKETWTQCTQR